MTVWKEEADHLSRWYTQKAVYTGLNQFHWILSRISWLSRGLTWHVGQMLSTPPQPTLVLHSCGLILLLFTSSPVNFDRNRPKTEKLKPLNRWCFSMGHWLGYLERKAIRNLSLGFRWRVPQCTCSFPHQAAIRQCYLVNYVKIKVDLETVVSKWDVYIYAYIEITYIIRSRI